jgi:hypothetical protein
MALLSSELNLGGDESKINMLFQSLHVKEEGAYKNSIAGSEPGNGKSLEEDQGKQAEAANPEYPGSFALILITIALCLAVFCVSLGISHLYQALNSQADSCQTTPSLPRLFLRSPITSKH